MKSVYKAEVRFVDVDSMGHVNNAVYLSYFEMARIHYFNTIVDPDIDYKKNGLLLVRNEIDYLDKVFLHDDIEIETFCSRIGNTSFVLEYELKRLDKAQSQTCTKGVSVLVCYDYLEGKTIRVPEDWRKKMAPL